MVLIMVTSWYPPDKGTEVGKKYIEVMQKFTPDPSIGKTLVRAAGRAVKDGIEVISINEVEKGKYEEALNRITRMMVEFQGIEGYRYEITTLMTAEEVFPLIGLKMPAM